MKSFHTLYQSTDRPIAVIGAAPSLEDDIRHLPDDCIYYAVNFHFLGKELFDFTYLSFMDRIKDDSIWAPLQRKLYGDFSGVILSTLQDWTHYDIPSALYWELKETGRLALWAAMQITSGPVFACGMNNRTTTQLYHRDSWLAGAEWKPSKDFNPTFWDNLYQLSYRPERVVFFDQKLSEYWSKLSINGK